MKTLLNQIPGLRKDNGMFLDALYHYPNKDNDWVDALDIIYKDLDTEELHVHHVESPKMVIFFAEDNDSPYYKEYMPLQECVAVPVSYSNIEMEIAKRMGDSYVQAILENNRTRNRRANKNIHKHPKVFASDYDITAWTKIQWKINFDNNRQKPITKAFLDIEVDIIGLEEFVKPGERPINAVTLIDQKTMTSYTFLLRNEKNPQIKEFEDNISTFIDEIESEFSEVYGDLTYKIFMYDEIDEIKMIAHLYSIIHELKRDFLMIWNMDFDIPYILERIKQLGYDPEDIVCHSDFKRPLARYIMRDDVYEAVNRSHRFDVSSYTTYLDQMVVYAGMRKGAGDLGSLKLNSIGLRLLDDEKIDYGEAENMSTFPYKDYWNFVKYNIKDVLLQMGIENKVNDIDKLYKRVFDNATPYDKAFKQTKFIENRAYIEYYKQGLAIGNNTNIDFSLPFGVNSDSDEDDKYDGGLVADPMLNDANGGIILMGKPSKYGRKNVVDYDFRSMYPNVYYTFNLSKSSLIGKLTIDEETEQVFSKIQTISDLSEGRVDSGTEFLEDYVTDYENSLLKKWFGLPDFNDIAKKFAEENGFNLDDITFEFEVKGSEK